jgi:hypothetical protein
MPAAAERAFRDLIDSGAIDSQTVLEPFGALGDACFTWGLPVPQPNSEGLPPRVAVRARIPVQFPNSKVEFIPLDSRMRGFAHQDGLTGALCLKREAEYPWHPSARLRAYVDSALEWFSDAASGTLLKPGQPWELPDFRIERKDRPAEMIALEDESTFALWQSRLGQFGTVQFTAHVHGCGLVPTRFSRESVTVCEPNVNEGFLNRGRSAIGTWLLLPSHICARHRPAKVFLELEKQCEVLRVDLWGVVRQAIRNGSHQGYYYLLLGAPIPRQVGGPMMRIHWQPIALAEKAVDGLRRGAKTRRRGNGHDDGTLRIRLADALRDQAIPWGTSVPYSVSRAEARGSLSGGAKNAIICVLGCGAVGAPFAEHLARGGSRDLRLFDKEPLEIENLSRHPLSPIEVGQGKAPGLARRLNGIHPTAHVTGFFMDLPPPPVPVKADRSKWDRLHEAVVLIDCTASESVHRWASALGRQQGKIVMHMFVNAHARMLTICCSGKHASCATVARRLFDDIDYSRTPFTVAEYEGGNDVVLPGAGCWHATFPGLGSNIAVLVAAAVPVVEGLLTRERTSHGTAVVLRRNEIDQAAPTPIEAIPRNLIEVAWAANYR